MQLHGGEVYLDGTGRLALLLQIENIAHQMLAADVLQLLQMVVGSEECAIPRMTGAAL